MEDAADHSYRTLHIAPFTMARKMRYEQASSFKPLQWQHQNIRSLSGQIVFLAILRLTGGFCPV
ncbi:hypothetical protein E2C01_016330 [Portunus trituberculatus]|uniref:Uncharacterized protein n=1 Tax=Portunus trituberculatus TaxID=210409 RepID=A0A5B7DPA0_PORTR|nr:hypothetical protein [Portunus trituberculatus]